MRERNTTTRNLRLVTLNLDYDDIKEYKEIITKDLSKAIRELIRQELDNQKNLEAPMPILSEVSRSRQTTITEYDIKLFEPHQDRINKIKNLSKDQQTKLAADIIHLQQEIRLVRKY